MNKIPSNITDKIGRNLYNVQNHPIQIVKDMVFDYFSDMVKIEIENPYVPIEYNFDRLRIPLDHPSRRETDTFYKDDKEVLRTHMTCYLYPLGKSETGISKLRFITCGDVYRKDTIDSSHYPIFHQIDAFYIVDSEVDVKEHLRQRLSGFIKSLFGDKYVFRFLEGSNNKDIYFPFCIDPLEIEVDVPLEDGSIKHLEILGAGTIHPDIMKDLGLENHQAWGFGMGVERLAMILFNIPDIRLFWSNDKRFLDQFSSGKIIKYNSFSKYETFHKDISMFINERFSYNDLCAIIRDEDKNSIVESVSLIDEFIKKDKVSHCYRVSYRSLERTIKKSEVNKIHSAVLKRLVKELDVEIR